MTDGDDAPKRRAGRGGGRDPEFEAEFGARIRALRLAAKMSQTDLGQSIGLSWQQVQKYEAGRDRVAVSTLQAIADALGVHPGAFFDVEMPAPTGSNPDKWVAVRAGAVLQRIDDPAVLKRLLDLAEALGGGEAAPQTNGPGEVGS